MGKDIDKFFQGVIHSRKELSPRKIDKPVVLYGAGNLGRMAKDFFGRIGLEYLYFVDMGAEEKISDEFWRGTKILHPDQVPEEDKIKCVIVICVVQMSQEELKRNLRKQGWKDVAYFYDVTEAYRAKYPLRNGWFLNRFSPREKMLLKRVYSKLSDDISRAHYTQFLAWHRLRKELPIDGYCVQGNRFFIPELVRLLGDKETFVDGGAHKGAVIGKFLDAVGSKYSAIYAFEPDEASFDVLRKNLTDVPRTLVFNRALSDKSGLERFCGGFGFASKLSKKGSGVVGTIALDGLFITPSFIKLHLEGGELKALKGMVKKIKKFHPIVAVTLYHNPDGAWKIPLFLINNAKNYSYYLRLHSWAGTGAVFYAIPLERRPVK